MKKKTRNPVPTVELVAYVEQLNALVIVCHEGGTIYVDSDNDSTVVASLAMLIKTNKLTKPVELIGCL